ncbi:MAG: hypothetical protein ACFFB5_01005 [Promethearchaeota archaeon]
MVHSTTATIRLRKVRVVRGRLQRARGTGATILDINADHFQHFRSSRV